MEQHRVFTGYLNNADNYDMFQLFFALSYFDFLNGTIATK